MSLQQKIHTYVGFALDGPMVAAYPELDGLAWRIVIDTTAGPVDATSADVISQVAEKVRQYGGDLIVRSRRAADLRGSVPPAVREQPRP